MRPADGSATGLSGVKVVDPLTVEIKLTRPDATFLHVVALNFSSIVPKEAVDEFGADFGKHPVGTGAFSLAEWTLGQRLVFARNPDYWKAGVPKMDEIVFEIGQEPTVALLRLQNGEVDVLGDGIPPAQFLEVKDNPDYADMIIEGGQLQTGYITLNVTMPPLRQSRCAQGHQHGHQQGPHRPHHQQPRGDRQPAAAALHAGLYRRLRRASPTTSEGAKALLAEAGFPDGFTTELYVYNVDPNPRIAQAIQQDLAAIGITVELLSLAQANVIEAGGAGTAPMIWSGGMAWIADFPDPSNFYGPILGCAGAGEGGWNWSKYCNEDLDAKATAADSMIDPAKASGSLQGLERRLHGRDGRRAMGAGVQRAALHHEVGPSRRPGRDLRRSGPHPRQLRLCVRQRCAVTATTPSTG